MAQGKTRLGLETAGWISTRALETRRERGYEPLTVAVLDAGGHLVLLHREDGSGIVRPQVATGKAWGSLGMGLASRELGRRASQQPQFYTAVAALAPGGLVPVPGGVLVRDGETDEIVGAVGVSGDTSDRDEECAVAGIESVGMRADTGPAE